MKQRNIFYSKVFLGALLSALAGIIPIGRDAIKAHNFTADDGAAILMIFVGAGYSIVGKIDESEEHTFTPGFLPGKNKLAE